MQSIADKNKADFPKYIQQLERIARYKPDCYFEAGAAYVEKSQPEQAKEAYENGVRQCRDALAMANNCSWLVNYYYDHGETDKALTLAKKAAAVYSNIGLRTLARLYERMGKLPEAEDYYLKIKERYDDSEGLNHFYCSHRTADPRFQRAYETLLKSAFPNGIVKLNPATLSGPPKTGAELNGTSTLTKQYGLHYQDVFVGVDGYRVETDKQYYFVQGLGTTPNMEFTVWNGKEYRTIKAVLPDRQWKCRIGTFKPD